MFVNTGISINKVLKINDVVEYKDTEIDIFNFVDNSKLKVGFDALKKGMEVSEHVTSGEVFLLNLEGACTPVVNNVEYPLTKNNFIVTNKGDILKVKANSDTRFMLIVLRKGAIINLEKHLIYDIKEFINNVDNSIDIINEEHIYVRLYELESNQYIERVIGLKDVIALNLEGETDVEIDDRDFRLNQDELITIGANSIYQLHTINDTKIIAIEIKNQDN